MSVSPDLRDADWLQAAQALLPRGPAWPREPEAVQTRFWTAIAQRLALLHQRARDLLERESDPAQTTEMLADWERAFGLPDACTPANPDTNARRAALLARITAQGGQSRAYFIAVAAALGYAIEIEEFRPFRVDETGIESPLYDQDWIFTWAVHVSATTPVSEFQIEFSTIEDPLRSWGTEPVLECMLNRLKPARTNLLFIYDL